MNTESEVAKQLTDGLNNMCFDYAEFANEVTSAHRTLQQNAMRAFLATIQMWAIAYADGRYDDRNADTCRIARKIIDTLEEDQQYLPHI